MRDKLLLLGVGLLYLGMFMLGWFMESFPLEIVLGVWPNVYFYYWPYTLSPLIIGIPASLETKKPIYALCSFLSTIPISFFMAFAIYLSVFTE